MSDFKTLLVWQRARILVRASYAIARGLPPEERFGLAPQMRRAAISISLNIAEGSGRFGGKDQIRMLQIAMGSARELEAQLIHTVDLGYVGQQRGEAVMASVQEVQRMLVGYMQHKRQKLLRPPKKEKGENSD